MEKIIKVAIIRPGKGTLKAEATSVTIPGWQGQLGILYNRQPLLSIMESGLICLTDKQGKKNYFATTGGFAEVQNNVVTLLCDSLITPDSVVTDQESIKLLEKIKSHS